MSDNTKTITLSEEVVKQLLSQAVGNKPSINTTESIKAPTVNMNKMLYRLKEIYKESKRLPIRIPAIYAPFCGGYVKVAINGVGVAIPCDGKTYEVPEPLAEAIEQRLSNYDKMTSKEGYTINSENTSALFDKAGLASGKIESSDGIVKVKEVSH